MPRRKRNRLLILIMLALILVMPACKLSEEEEVIIPTPIPNTPTSSGPGEISGVVLDKNGKKMSHVPLALALVVEGEKTGSYLMVDDDKWINASGTGIETKTDANGGFTLEEVPLGEYVFVVYTGEYHTLQNTEGLAIFELSSGEVLDVGQVSIWR